MLVEMLAVYTAITLMHYQTLSAFISFKLTYLILILT